MDKIGRITVFFKLCESRVEIIEDFNEISLIAVKLLTIRYSLFVDFQINSVQKQRTVNNEERIA
jgi:hypothetical protein